MIELFAQNNFGDTRSGGLAGPTGLVIILLLVVGTILLIRSMNKHLRGLPDHFPAPSQPRPPVHEVKELNEAKEAKEAKEQVDGDR